MISKKKLNPNDKVPIASHVSRKVRDLLDQRAEKIFDGKRSMFIRQIINDWYYLQCDPQTSQDAQKTHREVTTAKAGECSLNQS